MVEYTPPKKKLITVHCMAIVRQDRIVLPAKRILSYECPLYSPLIHQADLVSSYSF
jgi:hypothetical protein